jgi:hypothetical protein
MRHIQGVQVLLDGQTLAIAKPTLAAALRAAVDAAHGRGRIIVEIKRDGLPVPPEDLESPTADLGNARLDFTSEDPRDLVRRSLEDAAAIMPGTREMQQAAAEAIQRGDTGEALTVLSQCFAAWQGVHDVLSRGTTVLATAPGGTKLGEGQVEPATAELRQHLRSLKDALENEDWSAVADLLAYDLDAAAERWHTLLSALARSLAQRSP